MPVTEEASEALARQQMSSPVKYFCFTGGLVFPLYCIITSVNSTRQSHLLNYNSLIYLFINNNSILLYKSYKIKMSNRWSEETTIKFVVIQVVIYVLSRIQISSFQKYFHGSHRKQITYSQFYSKRCTKKKKKF